MKTPILLIVLATIFLSSCKDSTLATGDKIGNLEGQVYQVTDGEGTLATDRSGITVRAEGTSFFGITDTAGYWVIKDLPEGTYSINFSKPGYDTFKNTSFQFVGGGTYWFGRTGLGQTPTYSVTIDSIQPKGYFDGREFDSITIVARYDSASHNFAYDTTHRTVKIGNFLYNARLFGHFSQDKAACVIIGGTNPNPDISEKSSYIGSNYISIDPRYPYNKGSTPNSFVIDLQGNPEGTKVYVKAYAENAYSGTYYFDIATHKNVLLGIGQSSNIVSFSN